MSAIKNIQEKLGKTRLKRKLKSFNRNVKAFNIEKASSIGVVYDATNRTHADTVKKFIQYLKEERKEVYSLGYINSKDLSETVTSTLNYRFFDNNNLSKAMIPQGVAVDEFINQPFSILIDLNVKESFPIEYISSLSPAKFKVGLKGEYRSVVCDLVIDVENNRDIDYLIIQIKKYLKMINN